MAAYLSSLTICAISVALGAAITLRPGRWTWTGPAVGLSATMLIALVAVRLPGHGATAAVALVVAVAASLLSLWRRRADLVPAVIGLPVAALVLAFGSLPFLANGRIGELGASQLDDLSFHMGQADALREIGAAASVTASGYPIGPHAAVAAVAEGLGVSVSAAFTGLLLAVPVLIALTALTAFEGVSHRLRLIAAVLVGFPYLIASYMAMGAFKEPILALCFLGFVLTLRDARAAGGLTYRHAAALVLTTAGGVADFGMAALAWPAGVVIWLGVMEGPRRVREARRWALRRPRVMWALAGGAAVGAVPCLALAAWSSDFFTSGPGQFFTESGLGGNFRGQISPLEALGMWPTADFRFSAAEHRLYAPGLVVGIAVTIFGALWCWRRRELVLLSGALAGLSIYLVARPISLAYFSGKALAVVAPMLMLVAVRGLYGAEPHDGRRAAARRAAWAIAAASFTLLAGYSSALALRGAHVRPHARGSDLSAFRPIIRGERTLYLGRDNFAGWELRGTGNVWGFQGYSSPLASRMSERPEKAGPAPAAVDFDSVDPHVLDTFHYVVAPRTAYASQPPANLVPVRKSRWHVLWERRGATPPRSILAEGGAPGSVLECQGGVPLLASRTGTAFVRPKPVVGQASMWRRPDGSRPPGPGVLFSGESLVQELRLRRGTWEISMRYFSDVPLRLRAGPVVRTLPPYVADSSSFFAVGRTSTRGRRLAVQVDVPPKRRLGLVRRVELGAVAATRVDRRGRLVPLRRACGAYVDWFRLSG